MIFHLFANVGFQQNVAGFADNRNAVNIASVKFFKKFHVVAVADKRAGKLCFGCKPVANGVFGTHRHGKQSCRKNKQRNRYAEKSHC